MNREPVSDTCLQGMIHVQTSIAEKYTSPDTVRCANEYVSALLELKSLREAQPPAGCAELAREISDDLSKAFRSVNVEDPPSEEECESRNIRIIAAKLAPLFGLLAECRERVADDLHGAEYDCRNAEYRSHLAGLLQRIDAALGKGDAAVKGGEGVV